MTRIIAAAAAADNGLPASLFVRRGRFLRPGAASPWSPVAQCGKLIGKRERRAPGPNPYGAMPDPITRDVVLLLTINVAEVRGDELTAELDRAFAAEVDRAEATKVVVDMRAVTYITSTGVRTLLSLYQKLKNVGGRVVLCGLGEMVAEVLTLMRFIDATGLRPTPFEVQPDVAAAVSSLLTRPAPGAGK
jgi:anti-anti-sigma factor